MNHTEIENFVIEKITELPALSKSKSGVSEIVVLHRLKNLTVFATTQYNIAIRKQLGHIKSTVTSWETTHALVTKDFSGIILSAYDYERFLTTNHLSWPRPCTAGEIEFINNVIIVMSYDQSIFDQFK